MAAKCLELGDDVVDNICDSLCITLGKGGSDFEIALVLLAWLSSLAADCLSFGFRLSDCLSLCLTLTWLSSLAADGFSDGFSDGLSSTGKFAAGLATLSADCLRLSVTFAWLSSLSADSFWCALARLASLSTDCLSLRLRLWGSSTWLTTLAANGLGFASDEVLIITGLKADAVEICLWVTGCKGNGFGEVAGHLAGFVACTSNKVASGEKDFVFGFGDGLGESFSKCLSCASELSAWLATLSANGLCIGFTLAWLTPLAANWLWEGLGFTFAGLASLAADGCWECLRFALQGWPRLPQMGAGAGSGMAIELTVAARMTAQRAEVNFILKYMIGVYR